MKDENPRKVSEIIDNDDIFFQAEIKIGPFKLLNQLGKGKFATVSLGFHEELKEYVAIKQLKKSDLNTNILLSKEINIQKVLFHPYITKMYCVIEKEENIFIISEYCSKGDLFKILIESENGSFQESYSCKIFQQILSSLEYLHNNNICHRDIKLENILIDEYGDAKLSDFGLSKKYEKNELLKTTCGSPIYAAPEMLKGGPYKGSGIDIWSLGICLYCMVCGEFPFNEDDIKNLVYKITRGIYTLPEYVSPLFKDLIKSILETNPEKRITIEEIKNHEWINSFGFNYLKSPGVLLDEYYLPIDIDLIKEIESEDEEKMKKIIEDILMNKHNKNTINYYLKCEIKKREGKKSISDLRPSSELFLEYIKDKKSKKKFWNNDIRKIGKYYIDQILFLMKDENIKKKEIKDSLTSEGNEDKRNQITGPQTNLKKFHCNKEKENNEFIENNIYANNLKNNLIKNKYDILKDYIGPFIIIHDLIESIITKVINIEIEKNKNSNYSVAPSIKIEIQQIKQKNPLENNNVNLFENLEEKSIRKLSHQEEFSINKTQGIEILSLPKGIKNSFSFINRVQLETIQIGGIGNNRKKVGKSKRSESCHFKRNRKNDNKNIKSINNSIERKYNHKNNNKVKNENKKQLQIIKSIDLSSKGVKYKKIFSKKKNKSNSNISHLQINIIQNEIVIADNNYYEKNKNIKAMGLIRNYSQNYSFDMNKNIYLLDTKKIKNNLLNQFNSKIKNRNKIPISKFHNKSVEIKRENQSKNKSQKNKKKYMNIKKEMLMPSHKDNHLNKFLYTPNYREKKILPSSSSSKISLFLSPISSQCEQGDLVKNIFFNKNYSNIKTKKSEEYYKINNNKDIKKLIPLRPRKNKNSYFIDNIKNDFIELKPNSYKNYSKCIRNTKYQEPNNPTNSQLSSLFLQMNESENKNTSKKIKQVNYKSLSHQKSSKSPSYDNIKTEDLKNNSLCNKKKKKKNRNEMDKTDDKLIKTKFGLDKIKQVIKKYVGNNVLEDKNDGCFKFICKTKLGKDDLIFHLELISKNFDNMVFAGKLIKGETKIYKELFFKIKYKLI